MFMVQSALKSFETQESRPIVRRLSHVFPFYKEIRRPFVCYLWPSGYQIPRMN